MSKFTTRNGTLVVCLDPDCICNIPVKPVTADGLIAADEERWMNHLCDAVEDYLSLLQQQQESPKADRESFDERIHEAKRDLVDRFYAMGWDS